MFQGDLITFEAGSRAQLYSCGPRFEGMMNACFECPVTLHEGF